MISFTLFRFLLILVVVASVLQSITTSNSCHPHERRALLSFKRHLIAVADPEDRDAYSYWFSSWADPSNSTSEASSLNDDCCQWKGVTCSDDDHHQAFVTGIDLNNCDSGDYEPLYGQMKPEALLALAALSRLSHLDLGCHECNGSIPAEIGNLASLTYLNLMGNLFYGFVPASLGKLSLLQQLDLSYNQLLHSLPSEGDWSPSFQLQTLDLTSCNFSGSFPSWLRNQTNLSILSLAENQFSGEIPSWAWPLSSHSLDFSFNDFSHTFTCDTSVHPPHTSLVAMDASANPRISGTFPCFIANLTSLQSLSYVGNSLTGSIPADLFANTLSLTSIDLGDNQLEGGIPSSLMQLPSLLSLHLSSNHFTGAIPDVLMNLTRLMELDLSYNRLNGLLPPSMQYLKSLQDLQLNGNEFDTQRIPYFLLQLPSLVYLGLSSNKFVGLIADVFANLTNIKFLVDLYLSSNSLTGPIPDVFTNLTKLVNLDLSHNKLSSFIPPSMQYLDSLQDLDRSDNQFDPQMIPSFVLQLPSLSSLDLSSNKFTGPIPDVFTNLTKLTYLDLSNNLLNGLLPPSMRYLKSLWYLQLRNNRFLPQKILPCLLFPPSLEYLDLSFNNFTGISAQICRRDASFCEYKELRRLQYLNLASNKLTSFLDGDASCLPLLKNMIVLDVSNNRLQMQKSFSATLADTMPNLHIVNMNNNQLCGPIPSFIQSLQNIQVLGLGYNDLNGRIPDWIGSKLPRLQVLVLAQNNLTGILPPTLGLLSAMQTHVDPSSIVGSDNAELENNSVGFDIYDYTISIDLKGQMRRVSDVQLFSVLDLSANRLSGPIPAELGKLKGLQLLNVSGNSFEGEIPSTLGELTDLESLDLSRNMLEGHIPDSFNALNELGFVNLSSNNLSGSIPSSPHWLDTFNETSFLANDGLCIPSPTALARLPLCSSISQVAGHSLTATDARELQMEWSGFAVGYSLGLLLGILLFNLLAYRITSIFSSSS